MQNNENVPGLEKVWRQEAPGSIEPELRSPPPSEVTVCGVRSSFAHSIVSPVLIWIVCREYFSARIVTRAAAVAAVVSDGTAGATSVATDLGNLFRRRFVPEFTVPYFSSSIGDITADSECNRAEHQNGNGKPEPFDWHDQSYRAQNRDSRRSTISSVRHVPCV